MSAAEDQEMPVVTEAPADPQVKLETLDEPQSSETAAAEADAPAAVEDAAAEPAAVEDAAAEPAAAEDTAAEPAAAEEDAPEDVIPPPPPKPELPSNVKAAEKAVEADQWDLDSWRIIIDYADSQGIDTVREMYEKFLKVFPCAAAYWERFAKHEMATGSYDALWSIFERCLRPCFSLKLWTLYIDYMLQVKIDAPNEVIQAFEHALEHIGLDFNAGALWGRYKNYLKEIQADTPESAATKTQALRKVFQRAMGNAMEGVAQFWPEYEAHENTVAAKGSEGDKQLVKQLLQTGRNRLQLSQRVVAEIQPLRAEIDWDLLALPQGSMNGSRQLQQWRTLLQFEINNSIGLPAAQHKARCDFAFAQCQVHLQHFAEIWYLKAVWEHGEDDSEAAVAVLREGSSSVQPVSQLLHLLLADELERSGENEEAQKAYAELLQHTGVAEPVDCGWINSIRFARRTGGVDAARKQFMRARKAKCGPSVIVDYATMEWLNNGSPQVARKIFEVGLRDYLCDPQYVLQYAKFLENIADQRNLRVLFNRAITAMDGSKTAISSQDLWANQIAYELQHGSLQEADSLVQRRADAFPQSYGDAGQLIHAVYRYRCHKVWPCAAAVLQDLQPIVKSSEGAEAAGLPSARRSNVPDVSKMQRWDLSGAAAVPQDSSAAAGAPQAAMHPHAQQQQQLPLADVVLNLIQQLPPASAFSGQRTDVDGVMHMLSSYVPPDDVKPADAPRTDNANKRKADADPSAPKAPLPPDAPDLFHRRQRSKANTVPM